LFGTDRQRAGDWCLLAWIQACESEFAALNAGILTLDEARRIALGIAQLPELMRRPASAGDSFAELFPVVVEIERRAAARGGRAAQDRTGGWTCSRHSCGRCRAAR
jgi:hypothetical protein